MEPTKRSSTAKAAGAAKSPGTGPASRAKKASGTARAYSSTKATTSSTKATGSSTKATGSSTRATSSAAKATGSSARAPGTVKKVTKKTAKAAGRSRPAAGRSARRDVSGLIAEVRSALDELAQKGEDATKPGRERVMEQVAKVEHGWSRVKRELGIGRSDADAAVENLRAALGKAEEAVTHMIDAAKKAVKKD